MSIKLPTANRYLRAAAARRKAVLVSVASSSAIEGIRSPFAATKATRRKVAAPSGQRVIVSKARRSSAKSGR